MFKVLVVDDDPSISMFISRLLTKKFACKVVVAENGLDGLNKVKEESPEVIFLDVTMPVMSGLEMLDALKQDSKFKNIPVIMLTAISDKNVVRDVMDKGVISYLLKPLMFEVTYQKIQELFYEIKREKELSKKLALQESTNKQSHEYTDSMLIVSTDEQFRAKLRQQMELNFEILEAENGADGLKLFLENKPKVVCLSDNLPLLNEVLLAAKIRSLTITNKVFVFLLSDKDNLTEDEKKYFDIIIPNNANVSDLFSGKS